MYSFSHSPIGFSKEADTQRLRNIWRSLLQFRFPDIPGLRVFGGFSKMLKEVEARNAIVDHVISKTRSVS